MPLKVRVTPPREGGGRIVSRTKASTAKSTPPKTGTDAQIQRMNNTIKSLAKDMNAAGIRSIFNDSLKMYGKSAKGSKAYGGKAKKKK